MQLQPLDSVSEFYLFFIIVILFFWFVFFVGIWYFPNTGSTMDAFMCEVKSGETKLPAGVFSILNGGTFFYYIPCLLIFSWLWKKCDDEGRQCLVEICCGKDTSTDAVELAEMIGVGAGGIAGLLVSIATLIAAGVSENCGTTQANGFIALNVLVTIFNVIACIQVSLVYYGGYKKCLKETAKGAKKAMEDKAEGMGDAIQDMTGQE